MLAILEPAAGAAFTGPTAHGPKPERKQKKGKNNMNRLHTTIIYKGYEITYNFYGSKEYTVYFAGDDIVFHSVAAAKTFIDSIAE